MHTRFPPSVFHLDVVFSIYSIRLVFLDFLYSFQPPLSPLCFLYPAPSNPFPILEITNIRPVSAVVVYHVTIVASGLVLLKP